MKITALKQQIRDQNRVSIYLDGNYIASLTMSQLLEERLKIGNELSESSIRELKIKSADGKLYAKAMNWVFLRPRSTKELREYLKRTSYPGSKNSQKAPVSAETSQQIVDDFLSRRWVDDLVFAQWWVGRSSRKNKSVSFLRSELLSKGIERETITEILSRLDDRGVLSELVA
jgi:regulatory protein